MRFLACLILLFAVANANDYLYVKFYDDNTCSSSSPSTSWFQSNQCIPVDTGMNSIIVNCTNSGASYFLFHGVSNCSVTPTVSLTNIPLHSCVKNASAVLGIPAHVIASCQLFVPAPTGASDTIFLEQFSGANCSNPIGQYIEYPSASCLVDTLEPANGTLNFARYLCDGDHVTHYAYGSDSTCTYVTEINTFAFGCNTFQNSTITTKFSCPSPYSARPWAEVTTYLDSSCSRPLSNTWMDDRGCIPNPYGVGFLLSFCDSNGLKQVLCQDSMCTNCNFTGPVLSVASNLLNKCTAVTTTVTGSPVSTSLIASCPVQETPSVPSDSISMTYYKYASNCKGSPLSLVQSIPPNVCIPYEGAFAAFSCAILNGTLGVITRVYKGSGCQPKNLQVISFTPENTCSPDSSNGELAFTASCNYTIDTPITFDTTGTWVTQTNCQTSDPLYVTKTFNCDLNRKAIYKPASIDNTPFILAERYNSCTDTVPITLSLYPLGVCVVPVIMNFVTTIAPPLSNQPSVFIPFYPSNSTSCSDNNAFAYEQYLLTCGGNCNRTTYWTMDCNSPTPTLVGDLGCFNTTGAFCSFYTPIPTVPLPTYPPTSVPSAPHATAAPSSTPSLSVANCPIGPATILLALLTLVVLF